MREIRANFAQNFHPHSGEAADVISSTRANYNMMTHHGMIQKHDDGHGFLGRRRLLSQA